MGATSVRVARRVFPRFVGRSSERGAMDELVAADRPSSASRL